MVLEQLSPQDKKLLSISMVLAVSALVIGILVGLVRLGSSGDDKQDNWQSSSMPDIPDTLVEFTTVSTKPAWFIPAGTVSALAEDSAKKAIEGAPEAFKLLGIVETAGKKSALFLASDASSNKAKRKVSQLGEGDVLVGEWKIKLISASKVTLVIEQDGSESQTKEIELYATKKR
jgi:hypothetical protein